MKKVYLTIRYGKDKKAKGYILDISKGGIGVASSERIVKNSLIEIISKQHPIFYIKGRVVSVSERLKRNYRYRLGVKFVSMSKIKMHKIIQFILGIEKRERPRMILLGLK